MGDLVQGPWPQVTQPPGGRSRLDTLIADIGLPPEQERVRANAAKAAAAHVYGEVRMQFDVNKMETLPDCYVAALQKLIEVNTKGYLSDCWEQHAGKEPPEVLRQVCHTRAVNEINGFFKQDSWASAEGASANISRYPQLIDGFAPFFCGMPEKLPEELAPEQRALGRRQAVDTITYICRQEALLTRIVYLAVAARHMALATPSDQQAAVQPGKITVLDIERKKRDTMQEFVRVTSHYTGLSEAWVASELGGILKHMDQALDAELGKPQAKSESISR